MDTEMVVEVLGSHDRVRARHRIAASGQEVSCTVGRGAACDVVLDDPFVAPRHARIAVDAEGNVAVSDLDSVNGVEVGGTRLHGVDGARLADGVFRVGRTRLRVLTAHEVIAAEQPDRGATPAQTRTRDRKCFAIGFAVTVASTVFGVWTATGQPRELTTAIVTMLLAMCALTGLWIALWALASRVAFGESRWVRHAAILFSVYAVFEVATSVVQIANGVLGLHLPSVLMMILLGAATSVVLAGHLINASPMRSGLAVTIGVMIPALTIGAIQWTEARRHNRSATYIANHDQILPPAFLLRHGRPLDGFVADLGELKAKADAKRAFVEKEDPAPSSGGSFD